MTSFVNSPHPDVSTVDAGSFNYESYAFEDIRVRLEDNVLIVTLNRPKNYNAFNGPMAASLIFAFELADADPRVKTVVLTGTGEKSFCAGADLSSADPSSFGAGAGLPNRHHRDGGGMVAGAIFRCRKLTIAAMNGDAVGVGLTMVLPCDMRIISEKAKVALPFAKRGISLEAMSSYFLPRLIGHANALQIAMTADTFSPRAPCVAPLFVAILPQGEVLPYSLQLAKRLAAQNSSISVALNKALLWRTPATPEETHLVDSASIAGASELADVREGVVSFLEKRPPRFSGTAQDVDQLAFYPWWTQADVAGRGKTRVVRPSAKL